MDNIRFGEKTLCYFEIVRWLNIGKKSTFFKKRRIPGILQRTVEMKHQAHLSSKACPRPPPRIVTAWPTTIDSEESVPEMLVILHKLFAQTKLCCSQRTISLQFSRFLMELKLIRKVFSRGKVRVSRPFLDLRKSLNSRQFLNTSAPPLSRKVEGVQESGR